ncbi:hypothetical protein LRD17_12080 [Halorhodospira halochloris]|nr:hypothetical protein [Halorhodospira halochloris]MCG5549480.1 hypothetical protein [Halorhodospira halochloris]
MNAHSLSTDVERAFLRRHRSGGSVPKRPIDLMDVEQAPVDLVHRILRDGILLLDAIPERRIAFEVDARNRYFDLLPYLQEYRRSSAA